MKKARKYRVALKVDNITKNPIGHEILIKFVTLALLPPERIEEGLQYIEKVIKVTEMEEKMRERWGKFVSNYYKKYWISVVKPEYISVFNADERTNNCIERYHRKLNERMRKSPFPSDFLSKANFLRIFFIKFFLIMNKKCKY